MSVTYIQDQQVRGPEQQIDAAIDQHQVYIGERISPGIQLPASIIAQHHFEADDDEIEWGRDQQ